MRFFYTRSSVASAIRKKHRRYKFGDHAPNDPSTDRRGRHTKESIRNKRKAIRQAVDEAYYPTRPCQCNRFTTNVVYDDGCAVCTGCGLVFMEQLLCPDVNRSAESGTGSTRSFVDDPAAWGLAEWTSSTSVGYRRENHLAEVLKQATAMDPTIPTEDLKRIHKNYCIEVEKWVKEGKYQTRFHVPIERFTCKDIRPWIVPLGQAKVKKYAERWLQIRRYIYWVEFEDEEPRDMLLSFSQCERVHKLYTIFVRGFEELRKQGHPVFKYRHNVPFLNTCIIHILHQINPELAQQQKWYFTDLETIASRLITEHRIALILKYLREHPEINGGYDWFYQCLLPEQDHQLFREKPERFISILQTQINLCQRLPQRLRLSEKHSNQTSSSTHQVSLLTAEEESWISSLQ